MKSKQTISLHILLYLAYLVFFSFQDILESAIESCKFPPSPDAVCRLEKCHSHLKAEIYFTDPDFKVNGSCETQPVGAGIWKSNIKSTDEF